MANEQNRPPKDNPFTEQHYEIMCRGAESCAQTRDWLERFKRSGLDVDAQIAVNQGQYDLFTGLKREWFPNRP